MLVAQIKAGNAFRLRSGGGDGYGSPLERPIEEVRNDAIQGYVSIEAAARDYGVMIDPATFEIDCDGTTRLRAVLGLSSIATGGNLPGQ